MHKCAVCGAATQMCCSQCFVVFYCSAEHQLKDWEGGHRDSCKPAPPPADVTLPGSVTSSTPSPKRPAGGGKRAAPVQPRGSVSTVSAASAAASETKHGSTRNDSAITSFAEPSLLSGAVGGESAVKRASPGAAAGGAADRSSAGSIGPPDPATPAVSLEAQRFVDLLRPLSDRSRVAAPTESEYRALRQLCEAQPFADEDANLALLLHCAQIAEQLYRTDEAQQLLQRWFQSVQRRYGLEHLATSDAHTVMAGFLARQKQPVQALEHAGRALLIRIQNLGLNDAATARAVYNVAALYRMSGDPQEAVKEFSNALEIWATLGGDFAQQMADTLYGLGLAYLQGGEARLAVPCFETALSFVQGRLDPTDAFVLDVKRAMRLATVQS